MGCSHRAGLLHFRFKSDKKHVFVMEAPTVQRILDSAAGAADSHNFALAESLLREAARIQESSLGPQHPDLASTFNNLAIVCEREDKLADAGEFYQRAFAIASASLGSEHPLVLTSRENLNEFNRVHGAVAAPAIVSSESTAEAFVNESALGAPAPTGRRLALTIGVVAGIVLLGTLAMLSVTRSAPKPAVVEEPKAVAETSPTRIARENVAAAVPPPRNTPPAAVVSPSVVPTSAAEAPRLIEASLCQSLSTTGAQWQCTAASDAASAGSLYFYTRIATAKSIRVHHRWYRNGRLRQDVDLTIQANASAGYRTYSRQRLDSGDWRVELVTADGAILHQARVAIR